MEKNCLQDSSNDIRGVSGEEIEQSPSSPASSLCYAAQSDDTKIPVYDDDSEDDFFESLRQRQIENGEEPEESKLSENIVDSTQPLILLDTHHKHDSDMPDLISNISPTSVSTTTSDEKHMSKEIPIYIKTRGKEIPIYVKTRTTSGVTETASSIASNKKSGFPFRHAFIVLFLLTSAGWFAYEEKQVQKTRFTTFHDRDQEQTPFDIFQHQKKQIQQQQQEQDENDTSRHQKLQDKFIRNKKSNTSSSKGDVISLSNIFPNIDFQEFFVRSNAVLQSLHSRCQMALSRSIEIHRFAAIVLAEHYSSLAKGMAQRMVQEAHQMAQNANEVTSELVTRTSFYVEELISAAKGMVSQIINQATQIAEQVAHKLVTATSDLAEYLTSAAKNMMFRMDHHVNHIVQHVNQVTKNLASTNAEIQANRHNMVGGRESLIYVGTAAKSMVFQMDQVTKELASTNAEIQANGHTMVGARESFKHIGTSFGKRTSRILSRKLRITSLHI